VYGKAFTISSTEDGCGAEGDKMLNSLLIIVTHFVSDWILQPRAIARRKASSVLWMGKHLLIILVATFLLSILLGLSIEKVILYTVLYTLAHGIQDRYIWRTYERFRGPYTEEFLSHNRYAEDYWWYFAIAVDQILHLSLLFWLFSL
jgi:hypothetical protein